MPLFRATVVTDPAELDRVYRLRHRIYIEEMGLLPADHPFCVDGRLIDPYDHYSHQIALWRDDRVVGTARVTVGRDGPLEIEECCALAPVGLDRARVAEVTRFMVDRPRRCPEATARILYAALHAMLAGGAHGVVGAGKLGSLGRYYRQIGLRCVDPTPFEYPVVPGARYQLLAADLGRPRSLRRLAWRTYAALGHGLCCLFPGLSNRLYRRGLSAGSRARVKPEALAEPVLHAAPAEG